MARKLVSKPTYAIKLQRGGLIQRYQEGKPIGHVWLIIDSWDPRRWGDLNMRKERRMPMIFIITFMELLSNGKRRRVY